MTERQNDRETEGQRDRRTEGQRDRDIVPSTWQNGYIEHAVVGERFHEPVDHQPGVGEG